MGKRGPKPGQPRMAMTPERKACFLTALRESGGNFSSACRRASPLSDNPNHPACYSTFKRALKVDPKFAADVAATYDVVREDIAAEIYRRGQVGWDEPVYQKSQRVMDTDDDGKPIKATIRRFSDRLLELRARAVDPAYADKKSVHVSGEVSQTVHHHAGGVWSISRLDMGRLTEDQAEKLTDLMLIVRSNRKEARETQERMAQIEHQPAKVLEIPIVEVEGKPVKVLASPVVKGSYIERDYADDESETFPAWDD